MDKNHLNDTDLVKRTSRQAFVWLGVISFLLLFWGLGSRGLWASEGRWAEISRQMFLTGDFFHPRIGGEPYFDKPLLTYWFITAITGVTGILNEWVVRLPSAVFGVVALWATVMLGRRLWSERVGLLAGWFLLTCYGFLFWSRTAAADTENLAAITLCILWYWIRRDKPGYVTFQVFYLIAFLGALTKGLTAVVVPIAAILPDVITEKRWKNLLRPSHFLAMAIGVGLYLTPFLYASMAQPENYQSNGLALVFQENFERYFHATDHKKPFYIYFYSVPMLLLPWAPLFIAALAGLLPIWKKLDHKTRWLLYAIGMIFAFFTLSGSRRDYYILPITPLCTLLMAVFVVHILNERTQTARYWGLGIQKYLCMALVLGQVALPFILLFLNTRDDLNFFTKLSLSGIILGAAAILAAWLINRNYNPSGNPTPKEMRLLTGMIAVAAITFGGYFCWQKNIQDHFRTERPFIAEVKAQTDDWAGSQFGFFPKTNAKLLFYLHKKQAPLVLKTGADWKEFLSSQGSKVVVMQSREEENVPPEYQWLLQKQPDIAEKIQPWDSASSRREKWRAWIIRDNPVSDQGNSENKENTISAN